MNDFVLSESPTPIIIFSFAASQPRAMGGSECQFGEGAGLLYFVGSATPGVLVRAEESPSPPVG